MLIPAPIEINLVIDPLISTDSLGNLTKTCMSDNLF